MLVGSKSRGDGVEFPRHPCVTKVSKRGLSRENGPAVLLLPASPAQAGANAQYACRLRRAGDRLPYWPSNTCTRTGGSPPAPPTPRAKQRKNDADTRGAQRKRKQETKERATKQNTCYTSRFVRVILAQGPCYSSLCRSRGGCCTKEWYFCATMSVSSLTSTVKT